MAKRRRTHLGENFSEGARQLWLIAVVKNGMHEAEIQRRLKIGHGVVGRWLYGVRRPDHRYTLRIEKVFGIPSAAWLRDPRKPFTIPELVAAA